MFKRIIYPTDFSQSSNRSLSFALEMAHSHQSELIIFYTYRLISVDGEGSSTSGVSMKREKENAALANFESLKKEFPELSQIDCRFVTEVGFADERISSAIKRFDIDLLIIPESIQQKLEDNFDLSKEKFTDYFKCSVMLMSSLPSGHH